MGVGCANELGAGLKLIMQRHYNSRCSETFRAAQLIDDQLYTQVIRAFPVQDSPSPPPSPPHGGEGVKEARALSFLSPRPFGERARERGTVTTTAHGP